MNDNFEDSFSEQINNDFEGQKYFIYKLELDYIEFVKNWTNEYIDYYKLFKNNIIDRPNIVRLRKSVFNINKICKCKFKKITNLVCVNIIPEKISTKSPLTILNGGWGSGKTHFLNNLLTSIKTEKIKPKIIKKYIYIDSWKYLSSNNLINDFIFELGKNLSSNIGIKWFNTRRMIRNIFNYVVIPNINKRLGLAIPEYKDNNLISTINRNITSPTLVIIDNIERLGPSSWEIIRVIQKLSISTNLIFLLSINKDKFNELCGFTKDGYEWNLKKYISVPFYNLKPNYIDLIDSYNIPKKYNEEINKILTTQGSSGFLNVRDAEKILNLCKFNKSESINIPNKYFLLSILKNKWNPSTTEPINGLNISESVIYKIISNDLSNFYNKYIFKLLEINNYYYEYVNFKNLQKFNLLHATLNEPKFRYFSLEFEKYFYELINNLTILKKINNNLTNIDKDISKIKKILSEINNDPDLIEINNASRVIYRNFFCSHYYLDSKDYSFYNEKYIDEIINYLLNK